jgi:hypothetical protein
MKFRIEAIHTYGIMTVYRRCWREYGLQKFFVLRETDGKTLEEFRRQASAVKWAKENAKG